MGDSDIKSFIFLIRSWQETIWRYKYQIIACGILFGMLGYLYSQREEVTYTAHSSFFFEVNTGTTSTNRRVRRRQETLQSSRFIESARSRNLVVDLLLDSIEINGKSDYLGNHIIDIYGYRKRWNKPSKKGPGLLKDFSFMSPRADTFSLAENRVISRLQRRLYRGGQSKIKGMLDLKYDPSSDLYTLTARTKDSELSSALIGKVVHHLTKYNDDQWIRRSQNTYSILISQKDSIYSELLSLEATRARLVDRSRGITGASANLNLKQNRRQLKFIKDSYDDILTQIQQVKSSLPLTDQSTITVINQPFEPHESGPNTFRTSLLSGLLGIVLGSLLSRLYRTVKDVMAS